LSKNYLWPDYSEIASELEGWLGSHFTGAVLPLASVTLLWMMLVMVSSKLNSLLLIDTY